MFFHFPSTEKNNFLSSHFLSLNESQATLYKPHDFPLSQIFLAKEIEEKIFIFAQKKLPTELPKKQAQKMHTRPEREKITSRKEARTLFQREKKNSERPSSKRPLFGRKNLSLPRDDDKIRVLKFVSSLSLSHFLPHVSLISPIVCQSVLSRITCV